MHLTITARARISFAKLTHLAAITVQGDFIMQVKQNALTNASILISETLIYFASMKKATVPSINLTGL